MDLDWVEVVLRKTFQIYKEKRKQSKLSFTKISFYIYMNYIYEFQL